MLKFIFQDPEAYEDWSKFNLENRIQIEQAYQLSELVEQNKRIAAALEGVIQDEKTPLGNRMKSIRIAERTHYDR